MHTKIFRLNLLALSLLAVMLPASAADDGYPFSNVPLNMRRVSSSKVKPNIMFFIDNSGSMSDPVKNGSGKIYRTTLNPGTNRPGPLGTPYKTCLSNVDNNVWTRENCEMSLTNDRYASYKFYPAGTQFNVTQFDDWGSDMGNKTITIKEAACGIITPNDVAPSPRPEYHDRIGSANGCSNDMYPINKMAAGNNGSVIESKASMLRRILGELVMDKYYQQNQRWGVSYLNNSGYSGYSSNVSIGDMSDAAHLKSVKNSIAGFSVNGGTPASKMYYAITKEMREDGNLMQYRCQQNYVVMLSDGAANGDMFNPDSFTQNYTYKGVDRTGNAITESFDSWKYGTFWGSGGYKDSKAWMSRQNYDYGLGFMSEKLATTDLKTGGTDAEGGSWDDPNFPPQTIKTFTIAFGDDVITDPVAKAYLSNGASYFPGLGKRGYFEAANAAELKAAFQAALTTAGGSRGYATVAPAIVKSDTLNTGIIASINPKNWSGEIRFVRMTRDSKTGNIAGVVQEAGGKPVLDENGKPQLVYSLPGFGTLTDNAKSNDTRRVIASTPSNPVPHWLGTGDIADDWVSGTRFPTTTAKDVYKKQYVDWFIRNSGNTDQTLSAALRDRCISNNKASCKPLDPERQMGDVMDGSILLINDKVPFKPANSADKRQTLLVAASNDGMLHAFKRNDSAQLDSLGNPINGTVLYNSRLDYLPGTAPRQSDTDTVWARMKDLTDPRYGSNETTNPHRYLVNAGIMYVGLAPLECDAKSGSCSKKPGEVILGGALGQGGRGVYVLKAGGRGYNTAAAVALSQDNQDRWLSEMPLWESAALSDTKNLNLGYTVSMPVHAPLVTARIQNADGTYTDLPDWKAMQSEARQQYDALFVANGYFGKDSTPALYIYDLLGSNSTKTVDKDGNIAGAAYTRTPANAGTLMKIMKVPEAALPAAEIGAGTRNGLSSPEVVDISRTRAWVKDADGTFKLKDNQQDGIADVAYAGDYAGNLYRFDFRSNKVSMIYQGAGVETVAEIGSDGKPTGKTYIAPKQPITAAPSVYRFPQGHPLAGKYVVIFGTGSDLYLDDLYTFNDKGEKVPNTKTQAVYGIIDDLNREVGCNDKAKCQAVVTYETLNTQLTQQKIEQEVETDLANEDHKKVRLLTNYSVPAWPNNAPAPDHARGWFLNFDTDPGERVVVKANIVDGTAFFTTRSYSFKDSGKMCSTETSSGSSWMMGVNAATGGNLSAQIANFGKMQSTVKDLAYHSGYAINELQSQAVFVPLLGNDSNRTVYGAYQSGWQDEESVDPCANGGKAGDIITAGDRGPQGGSINCGIKPVTFKRISWREIF